MTRYSDQGFTTSDGSGPDRVRVRCGACGEAFPSLDAEEAHVCSRGRELHEDQDRDDGGHDLVADGGLPPVSEREAERREAQREIVERAREVRTDGGHDVQSTSDIERAKCPNCGTRGSSRYLHEDDVPDEWCCSDDDCRVSLFCETVAETERDDVEGVDDA